MTDIRELKPEPEAVEEIALEILVKREAQRLVQAHTTKLPALDSTMTLTDALQRPRQRVPHLVDQLAGRRHNTALIAEYKTGKTTLLCDLARCVADGEPFLGSFDVADLPGNVGFWSLEMDDDDLTDYFRAIGVRKTDRLVLHGLRDCRVPFMHNDVAREYTENWLVEHDVKMWIVDSWSKLCNGWHGIQEKDNAGYLDLCTTVDEIKGATGVESTLFTAHFPRTEMGQGHERARGGSAFEDWLDARWVLTRGQDDARFLRVNGRKVELEETALTFDPDTGRSSLGTGNRKNQVGGRIEHDLVNYIRVNPRSLVCDIKEGVTGNWKTVERQLKRLVTDGVITVEPGKGRALHHTLTPLPGM